MLVFEGVICTFHPELNGVRLKQSGDCVACLYEKRHPPSPEALSTHYFGKICIRHPEMNGERVKGRNRCVMCENERYKKRYAAKAQKILAKNRERYINNQTYREQKLAKSRERYAANSEKFRAARRARYAAIKSNDL